MAYLGLRVFCVRDCISTTSVQRGSQRMPWIVLLPQAGLELLGFLLLLFRSQARLVAETIALRAQSEVCVKCRHPRRHLSDAKRVILGTLDRFFGIRHDLPLLTPGTVRKWAKKIATLGFWLRSVRRGRPPLPERAIAVIRQFAEENPLWKIREIAKKTTAYLGLSICAATVRRYLPLGDPRRRRKQHKRSERWSTFIRNHANTLLACDFAVTRTLWGGTLYVLVVIEIGSRRVLHTNVTAHPTAAWTIQQFRECVPATRAWKYLVHDRDAIFSRELDCALRSFGIEPLRTPVRSPKANAFCERLIGTMRRECLDWIIPFDEEHLRPFVREWATHYNRARPHMSLGLGVPEPNEQVPAPPLERRHQLPDCARVVAMPILGGLSHEYRLERAA